MKRSVRKPGFPSIKKRESVLSFPAGHFIRTRMESAVVETAVRVMHQEAHISKMLHKSGRRHEAALLSRFAASHADSLSGQASQQ